VTALKLIIKKDKLTIINVYNPKIRGLRLKEWPRIVEALEKA
jgi:hypothetical protein